MIADLNALKQSFIELIENSGEFSPAERREAVRKMFSTQGFEWSFLCHADPGKRAFLVPAAWSVTPLVLSGHFAELVVWEPEQRRAEFLRHYYKSLGLAVRVINGPLDRLADHTERYSVVALEDSFVEHPDRLPEDVISSAARLLEPGGQCCVVTANRLGLSTLKSGVLSAARSLGQLSRKSQAPPSLGGLRRRLRRASLVAQRTYWFYPNHRQPREILGWRGTLPRHVRGHLFRLLDHLGLIARIHNGFIVIAAQERLAPSLVDLLLMRLRESLGLEAVPAVDECLVQGTGVLLFFINLSTQGHGVLRLAVHQAGALRMQNSRRVLALLAERAPHIYSLAPEQLASGALDGAPYTLERKLSGVTAAEILTRSQSDGYVLEGALQFLNAFSQVHIEPRQIDQEFVANYIEPVFSTLRRHHPKVANGLDEIEAFVVSRTLGHQLPLLWVHGDFNTKNVLFQTAEMRLSGVIDWDRSRELGLPLVDLFHFILSIHRERHGWSIGEVVVRALEGGLLDDYERSALERYRETLGLHEGLYDPLLVMYWAQEVARLLKEAGALLTQTWLEDNYYKPLIRIRCVIK